jgi:hypothetical protein
MVDEGGGEAESEAAYLASLSKSDRKLLARYTMKLAEGGGEGISKKGKKHKSTSFLLPIAHLLVNQIIP